MSATPEFDFVDTFVDALLITTGTKVGGGYDKNLPPRSDLWMTKPLWTIAEHVYDERVTRQNKCAKESLAQLSRHSIGVGGNESTPYSDGVDTVRNCLVDGPVA
jgi:hypothetical protein